MFNRSAGRVGTQSLGRTYWYAPNISAAQHGSFFMALLRYRFHQDRRRVSRQEANLISSRTDRGTHLPVLDLDFSHVYLDSTSPGHGHLYLNVELPFWRWAILMWGLRVGGAIEHGFFVWSLRRLGNFVRVPELRKLPEEESLQHEEPPHFIRGR